MKRKREMEKESEIRSAIEELSIWNKLETENFDSPNKIGPTMAVLRQDADQNIQIALKLVPDNKNFRNLQMAKNESSQTLMEELKTMVSLLLPFLESLHSVLILHSLDRLKSH